MNIDTLYDEILAIIQQVIGDDVSVEKDKLLIEDLGFESIQIVELLIKIEEKYNVEASNFNGFIESFTTVDRITKYLIEIVTGEKNDK